MKNGSDGDTMLTIGVERVVLRSRLVVQFYSDEL